MSVAELYREYARLAPRYTDEENPLYPLSHRIPRRAYYYCVVEPDRAPEAERLMKKIAGRRRLHRIVSNKDELHQSHFARVEELVLLFA